MGINVIAEVREQAHDANVANKIIDSLKNLKQSSDDKSRCRWIWELIQNAKDVTNTTIFCIVNGFPLCENCNSP